MYSDPVKHSSDDLQSTVQRLIQATILEQNEFDVRDALPNVVPDPSSLILTSQYSCPIGKVSLFFNCCKKLNTFIKLNSILKYFLCFKK